MVSSKKQQRIDKLFKRIVNTADDDCGELETEVRQLEQMLKNKENELFQIKRHCLKRKHQPSDKKKEVFMRTEKIMNATSIDSVEKDLDLYSMITGIEVKSFVKDDHCCILYNMQHQSKQMLQHGLRISLSAGASEIARLSLPLGFNYNAIMEEYTNVMTSENLIAVRRGLTAYYDRLEQFEMLKNITKLDAQLFKLMDGSHIEISFQIQPAANPKEEPTAVVLMLDYRVYDIRPKQYTFKEMDMPVPALQALKEQCAVFKRKPLHTAFKECFIEGNGSYKLKVNELYWERKENDEYEHLHSERKTAKRQQHNYDVTYQPNE